MLSIITIGDNNVDMYESGISYPGGNCPNVAAYAAMNGYSASYIGVVGKDTFGDLETRGLKTMGVDVSHMRFEDGRTSRVKLFNQDGERIFTQYEREIIDAHPIRFSDEDLMFIGKHQLIHTSIYSTFAEGEFDRLVNLDIPISFDFSLEWETNYLDHAQDEYLAELKPIATDFLKSTCIKIDYAFLSCSHISEAETIDVLSRCVSYGCKIAVGTRGINGSYAFDGKDIYYQPAYKISTIDTLGAGDSFITRFLLTYLEGKHLIIRCMESVTNKYKSKDLDDYQRKLINASLSQAALFAARTCQLKGAFGNGENLG